MVVLCLDDLRKLSTRCSDGSILPSLWVSKLGVVVRRDDMTVDEEMIVMKPSKEGLR